MAAIASVNVPATGGLKQLFDGENDISKFSSKFPDLADNLKKFIQNLGDFQPDNIETVNAAVRALSAIAELSNIDIANKGKDLEEFGTCMVTFAGKLQEYLSSMGGVNGEALTESINKIKQLLEAIKEITNENVSNLKQFSETLGNIGKEGINNFVKAFTDQQPKTEAVNGINDTIQKILDKAESRRGDIESKATKLAEAAINMLKASSLVVEATNAGKSFVQGFANGINNNIYLARDAGSNVGK